MALDRGRLAPVEPPDWVLDVMIGVRGDDAELPFDGHPLVRVAQAAKKANFTLLNVQLPAPPPLQDVEERQWLRLRVGVPYRRGDSLRKLVRFLAALDSLEDDGVLVHLREVPQMETLDATQTAPEDSFDELPGARVASVGKTTHRPAGHRRRHPGARRTRGRLAAAGRLRPAAVRAAGRGAGRAARARGRPVPGRRDLRASSTARPWSSCSAARTGPERSTRRP